MIAAIYSTLLEIHNFDSLFISFMMIAVFDGYYTLGVMLLVFCQSAPVYLLLHNRHNVDNNTENTYYRFISMLAGFFNLVTVCIAAIEYSYSAHYKVILMWTIIHSTIGVVLHISAIAVSNCYTIYEKPTDPSILMRRTIGYVVIMMLLVLALLIYYISNA